MCVCVLSFACVTCARSSVCFHWQQNTAAARRRRFAVVVFLDLLVVVVVRVVHVAFVVRDAVVELLAQIIRRRMFDISRLVAAEEKKNSSSAATGRSVRRARAAPPLPSPPPPPPAAVSAALRARAVFPRVCTLTSSTGAECASRTRDELRPDHRHVVRTHALANRITKRIEENELTMKQSRSTTATNSRRCAPPTVLRCEKLSCASYPRHARARLRSFLLAPYLPISRRRSAGVVSERPLAS